MKKIYFGLLLLCAVGALACGTQPASNNATPNANASPGSSPKLGNDNTKGDDPIKYLEVLVTITIADDEHGQPYIASVLPDPADLSGGMKVQWLVINQSKTAEAENATVEIGSFKGNANPSDNKPFGPDPCDNSFKLNFLKENHESREISQQAEFQSGEVGYSYEVTLKDSTGKVLYKLKKTPEIIVGGMAVKPGATPKATPKETPKPSPTAKPKK